MTVLEQPVEVLQRSCQGDFEAFFGQHQGEILRYLSHVCPLRSRAQLPTMGTTHRHQCCARPSEEGAP